MQILKSLNIEHSHSVEAHTDNASFRYHRSLEKQQFLLLFYFFKIVCSGLIHRTNMLAA